MNKLNKESSVALYQQLINEIKESIQSGELKAGDRLMTEGEFSKAYDVSRITVRKAIEVLVVMERLLFLRRIIFHRNMHFFLVLI